MNEFEVRYIFCGAFKDSHTENTPSNKTKAFTKSMNMRIWEIGTLNQPFVRGCYTEAIFSKN